MSDTRSTAALSPEIEARIEYERVSSIYRLAPLPQAGAVVFSLVLAYALRDMVPMHWIAIWLVGRLGLSALRALETRWFFRDPMRAQRVGYWHARFDVFLFLDNCSWSIIALVFLPAAQGVMLGGLLFAGSLCITAIGVFILVSSYRTAVLNAMTMLSPIVASTVWNDFPGTSIIVASVVIYGVVLAQETWRSNQRWTEMTRLRLQSDSVAAEREEARKLAVDASEAKTRFLANMSHEIRTPMNGILGMAELLQSTRLDAQQVRYVGAITLAARALHDLLGDILDLAKVEEGRVTLEQVDFEPVRLLNDVADVYRELAFARGTTFDLDLDPAAAVRVSGDPTRFRQIVTNLLGNAIKFTERGAISLSFRRVDGPAGDPRTWLRVRVQDTGVGMSADEVGRLFQRFMQADASTTRRFGGSGLGLVISKHLVELMGGTIHVESTPGQGSTFWFDVPFDAAVMPAPNEQDFADTDITVPQLHVLVVEDNPINQQVMCAMLERMGMSVTLAENGAQALVVLESVHVDLVFMDCQMPVMDGYEATARIRALPGSSRRVPVIAVTANAMGDDRRRCLAAGMDDYVSKPIASATLAQLVGRYLGVPVAPSARPLPVADEDQASAPSAGATSGPVVFDPGVLAALPMVADGSQPEFAEEMRALYADSAGRTLRAIEQALSQHDTPALLRCLHMLKSSSAQVGAMELSTLVTRYEAVLRSGGIAEDDWQARLRGAWRRLEQVWGVQESAAVRDIRARE